MSEDFQQARLELKFVGDESQRNRIMLWLKSQKLLFQRHHPNRKVHNIYFDTLDLQGFHDNLAGISRREKCRVRWYGEENWPVECDLEIKQKRNNLGIKKRYPLTLSSLTPNITWRQIISSQRTPEVRYWLTKFPQTILINQYCREYFATKNELIRLTIDSNIKVFDQRYKLKPNLTRLSRTFPNHIIIEFKFAKSERDVMQNYINCFPLKISRSSKYITGVRSLLLY